LTLAFTLILPPAENEAIREISYETYKPPNNIFFAAAKDNPPHIDFENTILELTGPIGLGTPCLRDTMKASSKYKKFKLNKVFLSRATCTYASVKYKTLIFLDPSVTQKNGQITQSSASIRTEQPLVNLNWEPVVVTQEHSCVKQMLKKHSRQS
jgi:hypothetical protein